MGNGVKTGKQLEEANHYVKVHMQHTCTMYGDLCNDDFHNRTPDTSLTGVIKAI